MAKERLDQCLVRLSLAKTRSRAQQLIRDAKVLVNGEVVKKSGALVLDSDKIELREADHEFVSRGGLKLNAALKHWEIDVHGTICLDIGASTGGFTDCLLQSGAKKVYAVDVGTGQLDPKLKIDKRIVSLEKTHIKNLKAEQISEPIEVCVVDVSFISLKQVMPHVSKFIFKGSQLIALVKPQFELGPQSLDSRGIVKQGADLKKLEDEIVFFLRELGWQEMQTMPSPILGGDGNQEFLIYGKWLR